MALTSTVNYKAVPGAEFEVFATVTGDTSYPAGGYLLTPAMFGLSTFAQTSDAAGNPGTLFPTVHGSGGSLVAAGVECDVDSTGHFRIFYPTGGGTVPAALGTPAITSGAAAVTSAAANGTTDITAGKAAEVATATNVSTVTAILRAYGH